MVTRTLAIDPGYERLGIAVLEKEGNSKETLLFSECFKTSPKLPHNARLGLIGLEVRRVIEEYRPKTLAIEKLFFSNNQKTALTVAEARGVILYEASCGGLKVFEYSPMEIKIAVTGYGRGTKEQVIAMVRKLIAIDKKISQDDEFDAIAAGITHFATRKYL